MDRPDGARRRLPEPFQDVLEDHRGLLERLDVLEAETDPVRIQMETRALRPLLERHFDREERAGGMFDTIQVQDPRHEGEIRALREDHALLLRLVASLSERAGAVLRGQGAPGELLSEVRALTAHLRHHEAREDALLTDTHYHEEGGGD